MAEVKATTKQGKKTLNKVYKYIIKYLTTNGFAPSIRDICNGVGLTSTATVHHYLNILADKGLIEIKDRSSRAIKVIGYHFEKDKE